MKNSLLTVFLLLISNLLVAQGSLEPRVFDGINYYEIGGDWHIFDAPSQQFYELSKTVISAKISAPATQQQIQALENAENLSITRLLETHWADFTMSPADNLLDKCEAVAAYSIVEKVELSAEGISFLQANDSTLTTQPPLQWSIDKTKTDEAWNLTTRDTSVIIAVIDHGIDWWLPDFRQASNTADPFWKNNGEDAWADPDIPGGDGIDNDSNGFIDDWRGWNFISNSNDVRDGNGGGLDIRPHGTPVESVAVARTNNLEGMAGVTGGWGNQVGAKTMILKVNDFGANNMQIGAAFDDAILYACIHGANVINISMGVLTNHTSISDAIELLIKNITLL